MATLPDETDDNGTLPNKDDENRFLTLALDRQCAFMLAELTTIREALLGSDVLIDMVQEIPELMKDDNVSSVLALSPDAGFFGLAFMSLVNVVNCAAWGDASLRVAAHLPPVTPFTPTNQAARPCTVKSCGCSGTLPHSDVFAALKRAPKPEWQPFLDHAEEERASGRLDAPSAATLRA